MHIDHLFVPVDFSEFSDKAVEMALLLAEKFASNITLAHVIVLFQEEANEEKRLEQYEAFVKEREEHIHQKMEVQFPRGESTNVNVDFVVLRGFSPADSLLEYIQDHHCDLVVMGTHGRTGLKHFIHGSVAEKLVRVSPVPVLTVHRSVNKYAIKKILAPIDFSVYSQQAIEQAVSFAEQFQAKITFMHVVEQEIYPSFYDYPLEIIPEEDEQIQQVVLKNMEEFVADQVDESLVDGFVVQRGAAHKQIVEYTRENPVDLLVISTHGLTGLDYLLLGSTAEKVIRWAPCPVLTVKRMD